MKKILIISFISIILLTGCGAGATETLSCTFENTANNLTTKISYNIDHEEEEIKKVRVTYDYKQEETNTTREDGTNTTTGDTNTTTDENNNKTDGVGTGTDGTTNDSQPDEDGIVDGIVGSAIDGIVGGVTDVILDVAGLKDRHATVQNTYNNVNGFSVGNTTDVNNNYKVTYVIDYDTISDDDLNRLNLSRNLSNLRDNYVSQGFTCK